jgi:hypothetical protein
VFETTVKVNTDPAIYTMGTRTAAAPLRQQVETALQNTKGDICLEYARQGLQATYGRRWRQLALVRRRFVGYEVESHFHFILDCQRAQHGGEGRQA